MRKKVINKLLPIVGNSDMIRDDRVYEPLNGCKDLNIFYVYSSKKGDIEWMVHDELEKDRKRKGFSWEEYREVSRINADNLKFHLSECPYDKRIIAIKGDHASASLFSRKIWEMCPGKKFVCPIHNDFLIFMPFGDVVDYYSFYRICKGLSIASKYEIIYSDPLYFDSDSGTMRNIDGPLDFGVELSIAVFDLSSDTEKQIHENAKKMLVQELMKTRDPEEVMALLLDSRHKKTYNTMLETMKDEIRRMLDMKNGRKKSK